MMLKLFGSSSPSAGRVEVKIAGVWGTVHQENWGMNEARVICRQLNYSDAEAALHRASATWNLPRPFYKETPEWLRNFRCNGTELRITDCDYEIRNMPNYGLDAGVICRTDSHLQGIACKVSLDKVNPSFLGFSLSLSLSPCFKKFGIIQRLYHKKC